MESFCNLITIFVPFSILASLVYILYLIVLNKFNETKREFYSSTLIELSQQGREWFDLLSNSKVLTPQVVETEKDTSSITCNTSLLETVLPLLTNVASIFARPSNDDQVVVLLKQLIQQTNATQESLSSQLLDIAESLPNMKKKEKKVEVKPLVTY